MLEARLKIVHWSINRQMPPEIYKLFICPRNFRKSAKVNIQNAPRTIKCRCSLIYKATRKFNALHSSLKYIHLKKLIEKRKIQEVPVHVLLFVIYYLLFVMSMMTKYLIIVFDYSLQLTDMLQTNPFFSWPQTSTTGSNTKHTRSWFKISWHTKSKFTFPFCLWIGTPCTIFQAHS